MFPVTCLVLCMDGQLTDSHYITHIANKSVNYIRFNLLYNKLNKVSYLEQ
jgi:hypothetical protein